MKNIVRSSFGRSDHQSSRTIFGAAAFSRVSQAEADRTLESCLSYGINHIDTAASYGDSEIRLAPFLKNYRKSVFLATKTGERHYKAAKEEIYRSLDRMGVENVDLLQLHNLADPKEWERAMGEDGALKAAMEARDEGIVRFIGVTGHGIGIAQMHQKSLAAFDFDSVLLPYSYVLMQNPQYAHDFETLIQLCQERNVAVQTIKAITRRPWGAIPQDRATWYQPLEDQADIDKAVNWVLGREGVFLNTVGDIYLLPKVFDAASRLTGRPSDQDMNALMHDQAMAPLFV
ncbi:MAG: aldo/keto reductase [Deinococcales bacterium]